MARRCRQASLATLALIRFTGDRPAVEVPTSEGDQDEDPEDDSSDEPDKKVGPDRGYFVDVKTLAAALTSKPPDGTEIV